MKHYALLRMLEPCLLLFVPTLLCEQGKEQGQLSAAKLFVNKNLLVLEHSYMFRLIMKVSSSGCFERKCYKEVRVLNKGAEILKLHNRI